MILELIVKASESVDALTSSSSPSKKVQLPAVVEVLLRLIIFLCFCCFVWGLIFLTAAVGISRCCLFCLKWVVNRVVQISAFMRICWSDWVDAENFGTVTICRMPSNVSVEQHALWDRWLDGY